MAAIAAAGRRNARVTSIAAGAIGTGSVVMIGPCIRYPLAGCMAALTVLPQGQAAVTCRAVIAGEGR